MDTKEQFKALCKRQAENRIAENRVIIEKLFADARAEGTPEDVLIAARKRADALADGFLAIADKDSIIREICEEA